MIILLVSLFIVGIALAIYGLSVSNAPSSAKAKKKNNLKVNKVIPEVNNTAKEDEVSSLRNELEGLRLKYSQVENEIELLKKKDAEYAQELTRREEWAEKAQLQASKAKEESLELERKFISKEKDLQAEFAKNVDLSRQLREIAAKISVLEKDNSSFSTQVHSQKLQIDKFLKDASESAKQIQAHVNIINEMKKKTEQSEWVSKIDFNKLNDEYSQLENDLEKKEEQVKRLILELNSLKSVGNVEVNNAEQVKPVLNNEDKQESPVDGGDIHKEEGNV